MALWRQPELQLEAFATLLLLSFCYSVLLLGKQGVVRAFLTKCPSTRLLVGAAAPIPAAPKARCAFGVKPPLATAKISKYLQAGQGSSACCYEKSVLLDGVASQVTENHYKLCS